MSFHSQNSSNWMLSLKSLLVLTAIVTLAVALKVSVPVIVGFAVNEIPLLWSAALSWLRPPYLYLLINCIILTIVATSKLQSKTKEEEDSPRQPPPPPPQQLLKDPTATGGVLRMDYLGYSVAPSVAVQSSAAAADPYIGSPTNDGHQVSYQMNATMACFGQEVNAGGEVIELLRSPETPQRKRSPSAEKPLVSARFGHRRAVRASPDGGKGLLGVTKPRRQETLESTWKTITEGRSVPLTRHLKKSDTWETHGARTNKAVDSSLEEEDDEELEQQQQKMKKSETFSESGGRRSSPSPLSRTPGSGKLRKEPSLSQDELNRRVEAFIKKFNEEMRLQRQESLQQYQQMIGRGAYGNQLL